MTRTKLTATVPDLTGRLAVVTGASPAPPCPPANWIWRVAVRRPDGFAHLTGAATEQAIYRTAGDQPSATRIWDLSEQLTGVWFPSV